MLTPARARVWRPVMILAMLAAMLLPSALPVAAADPVVLRVGEAQDVTAINPYLATLFSDYEVFTLNYDLLVGYGPDEQPAPGFASSWTQDGTTWTFKIDPDLKWSDGTPATSEDARWTIQTLLDVQARDGYVGSGYLDAYLTYAGVTAVSAPDAQTLVIETETPNTQILTSYIPILPKHIWQDRKIGNPTPTTRPSWAPAPTRPPSGSRVSMSTWCETRTTGAPRGMPTRSSSSTSPTKVP